MNEEKQPITEIPKKAKTIFIVMGVCMIAVALSAVGFVDRNNGNNISEQTTAGATQGVEAKVTNIPDERTTAKIEATTSYKTDDIITVTDGRATTLPQRVAPTSYSLPLGTDIGKDYSRGIPVYSDVMDDWRVHNGVDFNGAYGDGVKAIASGYIKNVYSDSIMGDTVVVDHGGGVIATYCGVTADEKIKKGIYIEECDRLGALSPIPSESTEEFPHLHLEISVNDEICDPLEIMGLY